MNSKTILVLALLAVTACSSGSSRPNRVDPDSDTVDSIAVNVGENIDQKSQWLPEAGEPENRPAEALEQMVAAESTAKVDSKLPLGVQALMGSYPAAVKGYKDGFLLMANGTKIKYDDGVKKDFATMLDNSDPEDMFSIVYRVPEGAPEYLFDPGRSRCEALFKAMYGSTEGEVRRHLVPVNWFGQKLMVTSVNGAADNLKAIAAELEKHPEYKKYMKSSGAFYWRPVRGAKRLSSHSYGIAIDIAVEFSDFWQWKNPKAAETAKIKYYNRIPLEIVKIFERHGYIWGGAWYHYDTMHFEYRPELLRYRDLSR